jgi:hypothetical protein
MTWAWLRASLNLVRRRCSGGVRVEPTFATADVSAVTRSSSDDDGIFWSGSNYSVPSVTGIQINQWSALNSSPVMAPRHDACGRRGEAAVDLKRNAEGEAQKEARDHYLYDLLQEPNDWQNGLEFREQLQVGLILRGNAYRADHPQHARRADQADRRSTRTGARCGNRRTENCSIV